MYLEFNALSPSVVIYVRIGHRAHLHKPKVEVEALFGIGRGDQVEVGRKRGLVIRWVGLRSRLRRHGPHGHRPEGGPEGDRKSTGSEPEVERKSTGKTSQASLSGRG